MIREIAMWIILFIFWLFAVFAKLFLVNKDSLRVYLARGFGVSTAIAGWLGATVVLCEALTACFLLWPAARRLGYATSAGLAGGFVAFPLASAILGDVQPCPCLGP